MSTVTLVEAKKLINNELVVGVAETISSTNPIWSILPWLSFSGQAVVFNEESTLGDVQHLAVGGTITAKAPSTNTQKMFTPTTTLGDAEVNGLVAATSGSAGVDQMEAEVKSKAKSVGRKLQLGMATGDALGANMNSLHTLTDASQYTIASLGQALSFTLLDELLDLVKSKDGEVDFIMMSPRTLRSYKSLVRSLNGVAENVVFQMPDGQNRKVSAYEGVPIFVNGYLPITETANGAALIGGALTSVYAGNFDDSTKKVGLAMIYPENTEIGVSVESIGSKESKDEKIVRIKSYSNLACFNKTGLARLTSINN